MRKTISICALAVFSSVLFAAPSKIDIKQGAKIVSNGWADMSGLAYSKAEPILIDDATYPSPEANARLLQTQSHPAT